MIISDYLSKIVFRLLLLAVIALLAGCQNPPPRVSAMGVFSPPDPLFGSTPIAAYDEIALALKPQVGIPRNEKVILISER